MEIEIKKSFECDVLVIGGGVAGFGAAMGAAASGAKVILAEENGYLGGCATAGLVAPFMTCYDRLGEKQIIRGVFDDLVRRLVAENGAVPPEDCRKMDGYSGYNPFHRGHLGTTPFDKEVLKRVMEEMCLDAGVELKYHYLFIGAEKQDRNLTACVFATKNGFYKISAKTFIDCTGDADVCYAAGAECMLGGENGELQPPSTFFLIDGVNEEVVEAHMGNHSLPERTRRWMDEIDKAREIGEFPCGTQKVRIFKQLNGVFAVNMCQIDKPFDVTDPDLVSKAEIDGRKQAKIIFEFLKKHIPGFENIRFIESSARIGIRESRRVVGEYVLKHEDILQAQVFDDAIVILSSTVDVHTSSEVIYTPTKSSASYSIPYRSIVAKDLDNVWMAGKNVSADRFAHGAIRVMPPSIAMGQAAGIAAMLASKQNLKAKEVPYDKLRSALINQGAYLG
ncbi:MAG: FAD-dependent oxidoreductase [Clostridia bacterium]|nr:FAD-dependent oxidoreductase [Clostridia bacterium]